MVDTRIESFSDGAAFVKRCERYRARACAGIVVGLSLYAFVSNASAGTGREEGDKAFRAGQYKEAAIAWFGAAWDGDSEQQELLADLLLGPHAHRVRHGRYDGIQYLYRAAIGGRKSAMLKLSALLATGSAGAKKSPDAARCWAAAPTGTQAIRACVGTTDFAPGSARVACSALALTDRASSRPSEHGEEMAKLCLANKTAALLVPGLPPSARDMRRVDAYARYGIEWVITGDVYDGNFEKFRESFNNVTVQAIEAERGPGYLQRLNKKLENSIGEKF